MDNFFVLDKEVINNNTDDHDCDNCVQYLNQPAEIEKNEIPPNRIVELHFKADRCEFFNNTQNLEIKIDDKVIVETDRGYDMGIVASFGEPTFFKLQSRKSPCLEIKNILRFANQEDLEKKSSNQVKEEDAFKVCLEKISKHNLPMRLVDVEYQLDGGRVTFYYTAEHRIDFRELVKDLANVYHTRIEMRQIGVRDETKRFGGIAVCGRQLCCTTWLFDFEKVSSQYATVQGLAFNPMKLCGHCGRLKCCLIFELENYKEGVLENFLLNAATDSKEEGYTLETGIFKKLPPNNNGTKSANHRTPYRKS